MKIAHPAQTFLTFHKELYHAWDEGKTWIYAAALSFFTLFSLAPLLVIALAVGGMIVGQSTTKQEILKRVYQFAGPQSKQVIQNILISVSQPQASLTAGILSFLLVLLGASGVFWQLRIAMNGLAHVNPKRTVGQTVQSLVITQILTFALSFGSGLLVLVSLAMGVIISVISRIVPYYTWRY